MHYHAKPPASICGAMPYQAGRIGKLQIAMLATPAAWPAASEPCISETPEQSTMTATPNLYQAVQDHTM